MLVLTRKPKESLVIAGNIVVTVLEMWGDKVRLGIEAPKEVSVHRSEVWAEIKAQGAPDGTPQAGTAAATIVAAATPS
jgi:carbon storage regulator